MRPEPVAVQASSAFPWPVVTSVSTGLARLAQRAATHRILATGSDQSLTGR
jgi:hypothetical protein